jgi:lipoate-protein ligase A
VTAREASGTGIAYPRALWRLLQSGAIDGAQNMAIDEATLLALSEGRAPPTLRFYGWRPPCLSLGYAQRAAGTIDLAVCQTMGYDVVRRPTGGRAVLHIDELAYSVTVRRDDPRVAGGVMASYQSLSEGLLGGLRRLGLHASRARPSRREHGGGRTAACFDLPSHAEITAGGKKLVGSAQVRRRGVVLQHGALPLEGDITRIVGVLRFTGEDQRARLAMRLARTSTTLAEVAGRAIPFGEAIKALAAGFAEALNLELVGAELTAWEHQQAEALLEGKYGALEYTLQR